MTPLIAGGYIIYLGGGNSFFGMFTPILGNMMQFDEHPFSGWLEPPNFRKLSGNKSISHQIGDK